MHGWPQRVRVYNGDLAIIEVPELGVYDGHTSLLRIEAEAAPLRRLRLVDSFLLGGALP